MNIKVETVDNLTEEEIVIRCREKDERVENLVRTLRLFDCVLNVKKEGKNHLLPLNEIYYFDSVDDKVFCYTKDNVYETWMKLYEIENTFFDTNFIRINKSMIVDASKISSFKAQLNGRMSAVLDNGERVEISRTYVPALKIKLGGLKK
jgi:two-component system response regulator LytT